MSKPVELEVKENKFYILTWKTGKGKEIRLYVDIESPIKRIKQLLREGTEPEALELVSVEIKDEKYLIQGIPWSIIASKLVKSD